MSANLLYQSFAGGEITPELLGRIDLGKYQTGLALVRNWLVLPHGPIQTRPGTEYVNEAYISNLPVNLIPFAYNDTQTMVLEIGNGYLRFHTMGGSLLEPPTTVASVSTGSSTRLNIVSHGYNNGENVYVSGIVGSAAVLNGRFYSVIAEGPDVVRLRALSGAEINTTTLSATPATGTAQRQYTLYGLPWVGDEVFELTFTQSADVLTISHANHPTHELRRLGPTNWTITPVSFLPTLATPAAPSAAGGGPGGGTARDYNYKVTAVGEDGLEESLPSPVSGTVSRDLSVAGNYIDVTMPVAPPGTARFNVYKNLNGASGVWGYAGTAAPAAVFRDANVTPDDTKTPPEALIDLNSVPGTYPGAVEYHEQRRVFAATANKPQSVFMTRTGTESNLTGSIPSQDDDAIEFKIRARSQNRVRHLISFGDLIGFTASNVFRIFSGDDSALTPAKLKAKPQGGTGASYVRPALTSNSVLFVQASGSRVRELAYSTERNGYVSSDMSVMAPHLFDGYTIRSMSYADAPLAAVWAARSDGRLLGMTYVPEHQVYAWHQHVTDGSFEATAVVRENNDDVLYLVVQRIINGRAVRLIERMRSRQFTSKAAWFGVDCGVTYSGPAVTTINNLHHLEGKTVAILAGGAVLTPKVVNNGSVQLGDGTVAYAIVHVGLPYDCDGQTLPLASQGLPASGQGRTKNVSELWIRMKDSTGLKAGPSPDKLTALPARSTEPYGTPADARTLVQRVTISPTWNAEGSVWFRHSDPTHCMILSVAPDAAVSR